jgi:esterase/lipase superfamily enzyme
MEQVLEWTFAADQGDRPFIRLERMRESATLSPNAGTGAAADWIAQIDAALAESPVMDVLVYVHGANTTVERAAGQASQLRHFTGRNSVVVLFAWPTAENFLRYGRDITTAFGAAPKLAELIALLAEKTAGARINVFTYSAGATVGSDGLALAARSEPSVAARIGEVYHAAPDADFRAFVDDMAAYSGKVGRVTTAVNLGDSALRLAGAVNRASRAGRPDLHELDPEAAEWLLDATGTGRTEVIQILPEAMPDLPATSHTFWYDDPWVSNDVLLTLLFNLPPGARGLEQGLSLSGHTYWTFPKDYPERMPTVVDDLRNRRDFIETP